jgi:hypothetical protein
LPFERWSQEKKKEEGIVENPQRSDRNSLVESCFKTAILSLKQQFPSSSAATVKVSVGFLQKTLVFVAQI